MPCALVAGLLALAPSLSQAQSDAEVRLAFSNLRSDDIPGNACTAEAWLMAHRSALKAQMVDEFYRTDRQGRDAIMYVLFDTSDFEPDAKFCQAVIARLKDEDKYVKGGDLAGGEVGENAWVFIDKRYDMVKAALIENLQQTDDMWSIWATICILQKHGDLAAEIPNFSPHVWTVAAKSLESDQIPYNAGQACRFYLIIGKTTLPRLQEIKNSSDEQAGDYASALIDAMGGSHRAYGYLSSQVNLDHDLLPGGKGDPDWLADEVGKWNPFSEPRQRYR